MPVIMLDALVPVFFGMALGYLGGWTRDVDNKHVAELNAFVMDFAVPASMFVTVVQSSRRTLIPIVRPLRPCATRLVHSSSAIILSDSRSWAGSWTS